MGREVDNRLVADEGVEMICDRLSALPDLYLPHSLATRTEPVTQSERKSHLATLLRRDAAVFLERYGTSLNIAELQHFEVLQDDYEVNWHLKTLKSSINPSAEDQRSRTATIHNRRLAYLNRLVQDGQYFSEDAMRMRSPLLHFEHVGQYQDPATWSMAARPGERYSDMLIRQSEEAFIQRRLREERLEAGIPVPEEPAAAQEDEESEFEEEVDTESEDEDTNSQAGPSAQTLNTTSHVGNASEAQTQSNRGVRSDPPGEHSSEDKSGEDPSGPTVVSPGELADKMEDFTRVMQEKFLSGLDKEHVDYSRIDNDAALDDDWMPEITRDAEEKYFEED